MYVHVYIRPACNGNFRVPFDCVASCKRRGVSLSTLSNSCRALDATRRRRRRRHTRIPWSSPLPSTKSKVNSTSPRLPISNTSLSLSHSPRLRRVVCASSRQRPRALSKPQPRPQPPSTAAAAPMPTQPSSSAQPPHPASLPSFLLTTPPPVPPPSEPRLKALYASTASQRHSNPTGYAANVSWWSNVLRETLRSGWVNGDVAGHAQRDGADRLVLRVNEALVGKYEWDGRRPKGLGGIVVGRALLCLGFGPPCPPRSPESSKGSMANRGLRKPSLPIPKLLYTHYPRSLPPQPPSAPLHQSRTA